MSELLWGIAGFVLPFVLSWVFAKINPAKFASWLSSMLAKVLKDRATRNKVENEVGNLLINLGKAIVNATPDDQKN